MEIATEKFNHLEIEIATFIMGRGDPTINLRLNIGAETRAKMVYENFMKFTGDVLRKDPLRLLMTAKWCTSKCFRQYKTAASSQTFLLAFEHNGLLNEKAKGTQRTEQSAQKDNKALSVQRKSEVNEATLP